MAKKAGKKRANPPRLTSDKDIEEFHKKHEMKREAGEADALPAYKWKGHESTNVKLHTMEIKIEAFKQYCEHLASGRGQQSWSFKHPTITLTWRTMDTYIANDRDNTFQTALIEDAKAHGYRYWEQFVIDCAKLRVAHDTNALAMWMRNKFKWDRQEQISNDVKAQVTVLLEQMKLAPTKEPTTIDMTFTQIEQKIDEST